MESFSEYPGVVDGEDRRFEFPKINWLSKSKFIDLVNNPANLNRIHPFIENKLAKNPNSRRIFVGKSLPSQAARFNSFGSLGHDHHELIGSVFYSLEESTWKIRVTHNGHSCEFDDNFLVLHIRDPDSFFWCPNRSQSVSNEHGLLVNCSTTPKYALRAAVDSLNFKFNFIGRTLEDSPKRPKYYSNGWYNFDEQVPQTFGKVREPYYLMFVPLKSLEIGMDNFETLCLKVSPAPLKTLCRSAVRSYANYSQKNIKAINSIGHQLVPESLIQFLKYPAYLSAGEYMIRNEKLVDENDRFELAFDSVGNLVSRSLGSKRDAGGELKESVIARNIDLIWINRLKSVFRKGMGASVETIYSGDGVGDYKFCIEWGTGNYHIKPM